MSEANHQTDVQSQVRIADARLSAVVSGSADGILFLDRKGRVTYANASAEFQLNRTLAELRGESVELPVSEDHLTEANVVAADGSVRDVEIRLSKIDETGDVTQIVTIRDVTHLKRDADKARDEVRRRDEFLAMLSHELRNPLAAIEHAVAVLQHGDAEPETRSIAKGVVDTQFKHVKHMLDDLLDVTRLSQGKIHLRKENVNLITVVRQAVEAVKPVLSAGGFRLKLDCDATRELPCYADATRLHQVITNLLTNAIQHSPAGSRILIAVRENDPEAIIRVRDYGFGIPQNLRSRIFEPFVQGQQHLARTDGGLGTGLALVKMIVELHAGTVSAHSEGINRGSEFVIRLPLMESDENAPAESAPAQQRQDEAQVLIVEDNESTRSMLKSLFELSGYDVIEAGDGVTGLSKLQTLQPKVAIIDIGLPGIDGYEVARRIRQTNQANKTVLLAVTGYGQEKDRQQALDAGFDAHLVKPVSYQDIEAVISQHAS